MDTLKTDFNPYASSHQLEIQNEPPQARP